MFISQYTKPLECGASDAEREEYASLTKEYLKFLDSQGEAQTEAQVSLIFFFWKKNVDLLFWVLFFINININILTSY